MSPHVSASPYVMRTRDFREMTYDESMTYTLRLLQGIRVPIVTCPRKPRKITSRYTCTDCDVSSHRHLFVRLSNWLSFFYHDCQSNPTRDRKPFLERAISLIRKAHTRQLLLRERAVSRTTRDKKFFNLRMFCVHAQLCNRKAGLEEFTGHN